MLSEIAAASDSIATPVSEKNLRWLRTGSLTKSWTHSRTLRTTSSLIATRSKLTVNLSPDVTGPRMASAGNWKTWNKQEWTRDCSQIEAPSFGDNIYFIQMALHTEVSLRRTESQDVPYVRAAPSWSSLQLPLLLHEGPVLRLPGLHLCAPHPPFL